MVIDLFELRVVKSERVLNFSGLEPFLCGQLDLLFLKSILLFLVYHFFDLLLLFLFLLDLFVFLGSHFMHLLDLLLLFLQKLLLKHLFLELEVLVVVVFLLFLQLLHFGL